MSLISQIADAQNKNRVTNAISDPLDLAGIRSGEAQDKALSAQQKSTEEALNALRGMFDVQQADLAPYREAGMGFYNQAGGDLAAVRNVLTNGFDPNDPAFKFQQKMGETGILANAGTTGSPWSGQAMRDLDTFNQGLTSTTWMQHVNALMGVANADLSGAAIGESAAAGAGAGANATGGNMANMLTGLGNSTAANALWGYQTDQNKVGQAAGIAGGLMSLFAAA